MRKNIWFFATLLVVAGFVALIGMARAASLTGSTTANGTSTGKPLPTYSPYPYSTPNKHPTPSLPPFTTCPTTPLPLGVEPTLQPGQTVIGTPQNFPYFIVNGAVASVNGKEYNILAGYLKTNHQQGIMYVQQLEVDPCKDAINDIPPVQSVVILMPSLHGAITITGIANTGTTVSFQAADGTTGHFDYAAHTFAP